jgi:FkbM family methyltransferase
MSIFNKARAYILNKIYSKLYSYRLSVQGPKKVTDYPKYRLIEKNLEETLHPISFIEGYTILARGRDLNGVTESCIFEDYTKEITIQPGDIAYDLGSCIGDFAILAAYRGAKVYAFEPDKNNFEILVKNIEINEMQDKITAYNIAIGPEAGEFGFDNNFENTGGYTMSEDSSFKVPVKTLSQVMRENNHTHIDLLKIDVEGSEYAIFSNPDTAQLKNIKTIIGEYHLDINKPHYKKSNIKSTLQPYFADITFSIPYYFKATKYK